MAESIDYCTLKASADTAYHTDSSSLKTGCRLVDLAVGMGDGFDCLISFLVDKSAAVADINLYTCFGAGCFSYNFFLENVAERSTENGYILVIAVFAVFSLILAFKACCIFGLGEHIMLDSLLNMLLIKL